MNPSSNGPTKWWEIPKSETVTSTANIIGIMAIQQRIALWDHLDQLVREGKLKQLLHHSSGLGGQANSWAERETPSRPPLGTINVIFAKLGKTGSCPSKVMSVACLSSKDTSHEPKRARLDRQLVMGFSDEDKIGTIQPLDDALVITLRIGGYDVRKVIVDQGSTTKIMYPNLYKGLGLRAEDLTPYSSPLVSFEGRLLSQKVKSDCLCRLARWRWRLILLW